MSNRRRSSTSLEVRCLYRVRNLTRVEDRAARTFQGLPTAGNLDAWDRAVRDVQRARRMRITATRCAIARARRELALLELRHGVDAYALREAYAATRELSTLDVTTCREVVRVSPIEAASQPSTLLDLVTVHDRGPNAPPISGVYSLTTTGGSPP